VSFFYGHYEQATETSLARILIGKYTKDKIAFLEINSSKETSIDVIRDKVESFFVLVPMEFDLTSRSSNEDIKYVFMDEYERMRYTSTRCDESIRQRIFSKNVRFILVITIF
jgi:DNA polymerase III delta prime subunit